MQKWKGKHMLVHIKPTCFYTDEQAEEAVRMAGVQPAGSLQVRNWRYSDLSQNMQPWKINSCELNEAEHQCPQFNLIISKRRRPSIAHDHNQSIWRRGWGDSSYIENTVIIYFTTNLITQTGEKLFPQVLDFADTREHPLGSKWHNFSHKKWRSLLCVCPAGSGNSIRA